MTSAILEIREPISNPYFGINFTPEKESRLRNSTFPLIHFRRYTKQVIFSMRYPLFVYSCDDDKCYPPYKQKNY